MCSENQLATQWNFPVILDSLVDSTSIVNQEVISIDWPQFPDLSQNFLRSTRCLLGQLFWKCLNFQNKVSTAPVSAFLTSEITVSHCPYGREKLEVVIVRDCT